MVADHFQHTPFNRSDGKSRDIEHSSMRSRAAMHDHSYHKILSTAEGQYAKFIDVVKMIFTAWVYC